MGILDYFSEMGDSINQRIDAANQEQSFSPVQQAMLQAGLGMMSGWGQVSDRPMGNNWIGQGIQGGLQGYMQGQSQLKADRIAKEQKLKEEKEYQLKQLMQQMQLQELLRQQQQRQRDEQARQAFAAGEGQNFATDVGPAQGMKFSIPNAFKLGMSAPSIKEYQDLIAPKTFTAKPGERVYGYDEEGNINKDYILSVPEKPPEGFIRNDDGSLTPDQNWLEAQMKIGASKKTDVNIRNEIGKEGKTSASKAFGASIPEERKLALGSAKAIEAADKALMNLSKANVGAGADWKDRAQKFASFLGVDSPALAASQTVDNAMVTLTAAIAKTFGTNPSVYETQLLEMLTGKRAFEKPALVSILEDIKADRAKSIDEYNEVLAATYADDPTHKRFLVKKPVSKYTTGDAYPKPNQAAINRLKLDPNSAGQFDAVFGAGSSKAYLGQ